MPSLFVQTQYTSGEQTNYPFLPARELGDQVELLVTEGNLVLHHSAYQPSIGPQRALGSWKTCSCSHLHFKLSTTYDPERKPVTRLAAGNDVNQPEQPALRKEFVRTPV